MPISIDGCKLPALSYFRHFQGVCDEYDQCPGQRERRGELEVKKEAKENKR